MNRARVQVSLAESLRAGNALHRQGKLPVATRLKNGRERSPGRLPELLFVYFIQADGGGPIKIGCSSNVEQRLADLQKSSPVTLRCLFRAPGGFEIERELHGMFRRHRRHGEWFADAPELHEFLLSAGHG